MSKKKYTALILGANGLVASNLLQLLIKDERYSHIYTISRTALTIKSSKVIQIIADFNTVQQKIKNLSVDIFFCCIGTTKKKTPNQEEYYKIDHDYPILVAKTLKMNGCETLSIISSIGANSNSKNFYLRLKGNIEQGIKELNYKKTQIFRPSLLLGKRNESRFLENIAQYIYPLLNVFLFGKLENYKSIKAETVAKAMAKLAINEASGTFIYKTKEIKHNA